MGSWAQTTAPSVEPVSIADQKLHLRLLNTDSEHDKLLQSIIKAARQYIERVNGLAIIQQTWTLTLEAFPASKFIALPRYPVSSITSITYYDTSNASQTFSSGSYRLQKLADNTSVVELNTNASWPGSYDRSDALTVTFVAGYGSAATNVPDDLIYAIKILAAHWFENPSAVDVAAPASFEALTTPYCRSFI